MNTVRSITLSFLAMSSILALSHVSRASDDATMLCKISGVQYLSKLQVGAVIVKCEGNSEPSLVGPLERPTELTYTLSDGRSSTIKNDKYNLNNLLSGPNYLNGKITNAFISDSLKKALGGPLNVFVLTSFRLQKNATLYSAAELNKAIENLSKKDFWDKQEREDKLRYQKLAEKYGISPDDEDIIFLDYFLSDEATGTFRCTATEGNGIQIEQNVFYGKVSTILLNSWNISYEQCKTGVTFKLKQGRKIE